MPMVKIEQQPLAAPTQRRTTSLSPKRPTRQSSSRSPEKSPKKELTSPERDTEQERLSKSEVVSPNGSPNTRRGKGSKSPEKPSKNHKNAKKSSKSPEKAKRKNSSKSPENSSSPSENSSSPSENKPNASEDDIKPIRLVIKRPLNGKKRSSPLKKPKKKANKNGAVDNEEEDDESKVIDPNAPLQVNLQSKAQKRKMIRTLKVEETEDVQEARRREQERLARLEKLRSNVVPSASSYESIPSTSQEPPKNHLMNFIMPLPTDTNSMTDQCLPLLKKEQVSNEKPPMLAAQQSDSRSTFDENADDDIILERVVQKPQIELVELSSDDEDQLQNGRRLINSAYVQGISSKKFASPQRQEELRMRRLKRSDDVLDKMTLTAEGLLLVNEGKPKGDPDIFVSKHLTSILQPHQLGGVRFMYDNVIESIKDFNPNTGFGCILAHSMGLGKTIQVITFTEIFFRVTPCKHAMVICPVNVIQNWQQEFNKWLPEQDNIRTFPVFLLGDLVKSQNARLNLVTKWQEEGGVLLLGYEMFRLLTIKKRKKKAADEAKERKDKNENNMSAEEASEVFYKALVDPGPNLVICDEGHRIKNLNTDVAHSLSAIRTRRRIVLTGYPLQNNLLEYYCMVDFVRPAYLGSKKHFSLMFDRPIKNGMCIDSTKKDVKLARQRTHVLTNMLRGFVQRRTHHLLKKILPDSLEYVLILRKTPAQKQLYKEFVKFIAKELTGGDANYYYNPLKAYSVCSKIWNHPDLLYKAWERQLELLDYSQLADAIDAAEGKTPESSMNTPQMSSYSNTQSSFVNTQMNNGFPQTTDNSYFNYPQQQQQNYQMYNNQQQQPFIYDQNFSGFQQMQQNHFSQQQGMYLQQPTMPWQDNSFAMNPMPTMNGTPQMMMASNPAPPLTTPKGRKKKNDEGVSEFDKAAKKKRTQKKKLVQLITDDDDGCGTIPYYWADSVFGEYTQGVLDNSYKMIVALSIIHETVKRGEKILLFSTSLLTLSLIEDFLREHGSVQLPEGLLEWKKNSTYFRFDGSTSGVDREKMIAQFNADPTVRLFLISTRAGSLGVNLVSASRVIIFDASWNPCHDAQAVCRIYRYGQKNKTYIYRLIMQNCMEKAIFSRQISKHGLQQRVVDEQLIDANVTRKELENLIAYDETLDSETDTVDTSNWEIEDELLRDIALTGSKFFAECPFLHESLMLESEEQLSNEEKMEAEILYEREKKGLLFGTNLTPFEKPPQFPNQINSYNNTSGLQSAYNNLPSFIQQGLAPMIAPKGASSYGTAPTMQNYHQPRHMPATISANRQLIANQKPAIQYLTSNPPKINARPIQRNTHVKESRRIIVDENMTLNSVTAPGKKHIVRPGDAVFLIRTVNGSVYLRDSSGQLMDATQTKYAKIPEPPHPDEIIELD